MLIPTFGGRRNLRKTSGGGGTSGAYGRRDQGQVQGNLSPVPAQGPAGGQDRDDRQLRRVGGVRAGHVPGTDRESGGVPGEALRKEKNQAQLLSGREFRVYDQF